MGAWWANDPWVWWESLALVGAVVMALTLIIIIAIVSTDRTV